MIQARAELEGRKRALLRGEHYTSEPLSRDHQDDILRWIHDLGVAITALEEVTLQRDQLRGALVGLVGVDGRADLEQIATVMRAVPDATDRAVTVAAVQALIATLSEREKEPDASLP